MSGLGQRARPLHQRNPSRPRPGRGAGGQRLTRSLSTGSEAVSRGQGGKKSRAGDSGEQEAETGYAGLEGQCPENKKLGETEKQVTVRLSELWVRQGALVQDRLRLPRLSLLAACRSPCLQSEGLSALQRACSFGGQARGLPAGSSVLLPQRGNSQAGRVNISGTVFESSVKKYTEVPGPKLTP